MICVIALVVFGILAIFSAKYRPLAKEAVDCVFRRVTFRPCTSNLDQRLKSMITGKLLRKNKSLARFVHRRFELLSWAFLLIFLFSLVQVGISVYNYATYGNCNGPDESGFCILDPLGDQGAISNGDVCPADGAKPKQELSAPKKINLTGNPSWGEGSVLVVEFGCYSCPNTAKQEKDLIRLREELAEHMTFVYVDYPLSNHAFSRDASVAAQCVYEQSPEQYWEYHELLLERQDEFTPELMRTWALSLGLSADVYDACLSSPSTKDEIDHDILLGDLSGVYGTPTFFVADKPLLGVKPFKLLRAKIKEYENNP